MYRVLVFAGTTEGYEICRFLARYQVPVYACAATEYGGKALQENAYLHVRTGRMDEKEMEELLNDVRPELVLDATHPYAAVVTENIRTACERLAVPYERVLREEGGRCENAVCVESVEAAVDWLEKTEGNILLTTGSKELKAFTALSGYRERLYARVLSLPSVMTACAELGFEGKHLIGMQGPFSAELNAAILKQYHCRYLVTKDSGKTGGFEEKVEAALMTGAVPVIIGRPAKETGMSLAECRRFLTERFDIHPEPEITLVGIGMGSEETLTVQGKRALEEADLLIGARRIADAVRLPRHEVLYEYDSEKIVEYICRHPEYERIVIALSGDVGFYSGARKLLSLLGEKANVICGISSVGYFMARAGLSWDDAKIVSAHGRDCNLVSHVCHYKKVFAILGTSEGVAELARKLVYYGLGEVTLHVGENLSYPNEKVFSGKACDLTDYVGDPLSVVCAVNDGAESLPATHGIVDDAFLRGKAPMTKEEVRTVSLSKLQLKEDSVCYDVGAGTGSVSVEMAIRAVQGKVYAVEKKDGAVELLQENKRKFAVDNLEIIQGTAPEALRELPVPTHAFIGGSSGNLREILETVTEKNHRVRIVINCITLETVSEALFAMKELGFEETEIVQMSVSRSREIGRYHMMMGENPIYIITCQHNR